ncbi:MAG: hypothetical protein ACI9A2_004281 [Halioglobus sp.]|jgi:hypothetical protein
MRNFFTTIILLALSAIAFQASATPIFSSSATVTSADRTATFTGISGSLVSYTEDALIVAAPGNTCCFPNVHYESGGNYSFVTITGTDDAVFSAMDFVLSNGQGGSTTNVRWETYLDGILTGSGLESGVNKNIVVGWMDLSGFDEVRVAAAGSEALPGFGNHQSIALDNLRAQVEVSVPAPAPLLMIIVGLGLLRVLRRPAS